MNMSLSKITKTPTATLDLSAKRHFRLRQAAVFPGPSRRALPNEASPTFVIEEAASPARIRDGVRLVAGGALRTGQMSGADRAEKNKTNSRSPAYTEKVIVMPGMRTLHDSYIRSLM